MNDTIIVGAGVIGLAIAWRAAQLGVPVVVVDRAEPTRGASWVAAGMLAPITEATFGEEDLLALNLESARRYPSFLAELSEVSGIDVSPASSGTLFVALDRDQLEALHRLHNFQTSLGLPAEWLSAGGCRSLEPALHPRVRGAVRVSEDRDVDPRELARALRRALERAGGMVRGSVEVAEILFRGGRARGVRLADGTQMRAERVVVAAGCWSGTIRGVPPEVAAALRPVKGQILRLRPRQTEPPLTSHVIRTEDAYIVPRKGGGLVVGATVEERGFDMAVTAGAVFELLRAADEALPGIRELELVEAAAGLRPGTPDNAPLLGQTWIEGLIMASGHYRNGILLAPVTADSIAAVIAKGEPPPEIEPFDPIRFRR